MSHTLKQSGFTILELMIATIVFSFILLLCATAVVQVGKQYYKGVTINRTQNTARLVAEDVSQAIQFGSKGYSAGSGVQCIGSIRYSYVTDKSLGPDTGQSRHVLWKDRIADGAPCTSVVLTNAVPSTEGEELLGEDMRLSAFQITPPPAGSVIWNINITVAYGKDDGVFRLISAPSTYDYTECAPINVGGQFCATSTISTNAVKRI